MVIKEIKKIKGLYEITFENEIIKYHEEVIIKYGLLKQNIKLSEIEFNNSLLDNRYYLCRDKALKYLINIKFIKQIKEHLLKYEEDVIVNRVIDNLIKNNIIDDYNTSLIYVNSKYNKGYGSKELKRKLNDFNVNKEIINNVLIECREEEINSIDKYSNKLLKTIKALNINDLKRKIEQRLQIHGYLYEDIKKSIDNLNLYDYEFNNDIINKYYEKALKKYCNEENEYKKQQKIINFMLNKGFNINDIKKLIS